MVMRVRNTGDREVPNLAITVTTDASTHGDSVTAFGQNLEDTTLADRAPAGVDRRPRPVRRPVRLHEHVVASGRSPPAARSSSAGA